MDKDVVQYFFCDRPGCNCLVAGKRFEDGKVVEEEYVPDAVVNEEGMFCTQECYEHRDEFLDIEDIMEEQD